MMETLRNSSLRLGHKSRLCLLFYVSRSDPTAPLRKCWNNEVFAVNRFLLVSRGYLNSFFDDSDRSRVECKIKFGEYVTMYKRFGGKVISVCHENHHPLCCLLEIAVIPSIKLDVPCFEFSFELSLKIAKVCRALRNNPNVSAIQVLVGSWYDGTAKGTLSTWLDLLPKKIVLLKMFDWTLYETPTNQPLRLLSVDSNQTRGEYPPAFSRCFSFPAETIQIDFPATVVMDEDHPKAHTAYKFNFTANDFLPVTYHSALKHLILTTWVQIVSTDRIVEILQHNFLSFLQLLPPIRTTLRLELRNYSRFIKTPMNIIDFTPMLLHFSNILKPFLNSIVDSQTSLYQLEFKTRLIYNESKATEIPLIIEKFSTVLSDWNWNYDKETRKFTGRATYRGILLSFKHKLLLEDDDNTTLFYWG
ncbi:hypothetical protein M3Y95_01102800 [Aphelenchoides besseyi]|nr:hypothetical protein M3Y95_01102800 [Aphelenchoides besseyi]